MDNAPKLCSTDTTLLLSEAYDNTYGIFNHDDVSVLRPLALVAMHPSENASVGSTLYERIEQFADLGVTKHFGLSLAEFLEFPTDVVNKIFEVCARRQQVEGVVATEMNKQLEGHK
jgi:hypothetical protein